MLAQDGTVRRGLQLEQGSALVAATYQAVCESVHQVFDCLNAAADVTVGTVASSFAVQNSSAAGYATDGNRQSCMSRLHVSSQRSCHLDTRPHPMRHAISRCWRYVRAGLALASSAGMTRSPRVAKTQRPSASHRARDKAPRDPSITPLGVTCFRLVALHDGELGFAARRLATLTVAMVAFARPRESRREQYPQRVTAMDRIIRETLARHTVAAS